MTRQNKLRSGIAALIAAFSVLLATAGPAGATTGAGGLNILYAGAGQMAHKCNVIGGQKAEYEAVVCADLDTSENTNDFYVNATAEEYCQLTKNAEVVPCEQIVMEPDLYVGNGGSTGSVHYECFPGAASQCPDTRFVGWTRNWAYSIKAGENGVCSRSTGSAYQVWGIVLSESWIETPDGHTYYVYQGANDGGNESSGHNFVCP